MTEALEGMEPMPPLGADDTLLDEPEPQEVDLPGDTPDDDDEPEP